MKKILFSSALVALVSLPAFAHTALMSCIDNGDGSVTCEAGFSDGSASGVEFKVLQNGKVIIEGKFDKDSMYTFKKPEGEYKARMFAGEGHEVIVDSKDISK